MTSFANAFKTTTNKTFTENGAVVEKTTGNPVLDFSHKIIRDTPVTEITTGIKNIIDYAEKNNDVETLHDVFVLMFHKRNPRGGEGEKAITYQILLDLYDAYPSTIVSLVHLIADFGYFKDVYQIWEKICDIIRDEVGKAPETDKKKAVKYYHQKYDKLVQELIRYTIQQREDDLNILSNNGTNISLLGKWIPREGSHYAKKCYWYILNKEQMIVRRTLVDVLVYNLAAKCNIKLDPERKFPAYWYKKYRKGNTLLNDKLQVPEIAMCANKYADIKFERVTSRAMIKYRKAFMNEQLKVVPKPYEEETGNRFPDKQDRVQARQHLKSLLLSNASQKLKASTLEPHEILKKLTTSANVSNMDKEILFAMWEAKKNDVRKHLTEVMEQLKGQGINMGDIPRPGKLIPMADVSGSMCGSMNNNPAPIDIAISLSIMTAELHPEDSPFRDMLISFTDIPQYFKFNPGQNLIERYKEIIKYCGYNTNFRLAQEELLKLCIKNNVKEEDIPDLVVFSDMQFDQWGPASYMDIYKKNNNRTSWTTHHQQLSKLWAKAGYTKMPRIIYWNLRGGTPGVQTDAHHPGVQMLQGFSPNLIKFILMGEKYEDTTQIVEVDGKTIDMKVSSVTPWQTFRDIIDQSRYDIVRVILNDSNEKLLNNYKFTMISSNEEVKQNEETPDGFEVI